MLQRRLRFTAAAVALSAVVAMATPAHAAGRLVRMPGIGWLENAMQRIARLWVDGGQEQRTKIGAAIDPNGGTPPPPPPGAAMDPNG